MMKWILVLARYWYFIHAYEQFKEVTPDVYYHSEALR